MFSMLQPGQNVGPYRLLFPLGKGGMGEVWAAQRGDGSKAIALKLVSLPSMDSRHAGLFADEARLAVTLQHPAIVRTFEVGVDRDFCFLAMELVRGPSLGALLQRLSKRRRVLEPAVVARIGLAVATGLDYAHGLERDGQPLQLVHRDVSPQNILIDERGRALLTDFGIARSSGQLHTTVVGGVLGKPAYMAPEQVLADEVDARTDLFALGVVLYEAACTRRLFARPTRAASLSAVVRYAPIGLNRLDPTVPAALSAIIMRLIEKSPARRFQTAAELALALHPVAEELAKPERAATSLQRAISGEFPEGAFLVEGKGHSSGSPSASPRETLPADQWPTMIDGEPIAAEEAPGTLIEPTAVERTEARGRAPQPKATTTSRNWTAIIVASVLSATASALVLRVGAEKKGEEAIAILPSSSAAPSVAPAQVPAIAASPPPTSIAPATVPVATAAAPDVSGAPIGEAIPPAPTTPEPATARPTSAPDSVGACRSNFNLDCLAVALWARDRGQLAEHDEILARGCAQRFKAACAAAGNAAMASARVDEAGSFWAKACELDDAPSCAQVSSVYSTKGPKREALRLAGHGCLDLHDGNSCGWAAGFAEGDPVKGLKFAVKGCDLDNAVSCNWARRYSAEQEQPQRAEAFARKACELGERSACP